MNLINKLLALRNMVDYPLRQLFRWKRGTTHLQSGHDFDNYAFLEEPDRTRAHQMEQQYLHNYHLDKIKQALSGGYYYENLFYIHMLEETFKLLNMVLPDHIRCADIGTSHWFYVQALWSFYTWYQSEEPREVSLEGYEVDAFRIYSDFHSRFDHALTHIHETPGIHFIPENFKSTGSKYDVITLFFPFVFEKDSLEWGLPSQFHRPDILLQDAWSSVKPGGVLMIVNQGKDEHAAQIQMFDKLGIVPDIKLHIDPLLFKYDYDRYILAVIK